MNETLINGQQLVYSYLNVTASLLVTDEAGLILDANQRFCGLLGIDLIDLKDNDVRTFNSEAKEPVQAANKKEAQFISKSGF